MKKTLSTMAAVLLMVSVAAAGVTGDKHYGQPFTIEEVTPLKDILESPDDYVGKEIRTGGYIYEMCTSMGCWIGILPSLDSGEMVKIAWAETDVRFPIGEETTGRWVELQGKIVTAEQEEEAHAAHMEAEGMEHEHAHEEMEGHEHETRTIYTCSMNCPGSESDAPGRCPMCNMELQPKEVPVPQFGDIAIEGIGAVVKEK